MKKEKILFILLPILLSSCGNNDITSNESINNSSQEVGDISIYSFEDNLKQNDIEEYVFNTSYKEYSGILTPTSSDLLTFTLSDDGTYYIVSDKEYKLNVSNLVIPSTYNSLPVEEIASEGFAYKSWLNSVVIPSSIKRIGAGAFNGTALKTIYYDAIEVEDFSARNWVFYDSENNQSIDIYFGKNVKRIPNRLFFPLATDPNKVCNVNNIYFSSECHLLSIGEYAFYKLSKVQNISLPKTVKSIGKYAFYECGINEIDLSNVDTIGEYAFSFSNIKHVNLTNVISIDKGAFSYCYNLLEVDLRNSNINIINDFVFKKCSSLTNVVFNNEITSIGEESFSYCTSLKQFIAPTKLISIGLKAFYENTSLEDIRLNEMLNVINNYAFYNTFNLKRLYISSNLDDFSLGNNIFTNSGKKSNLQVAFLDGVIKIPSNFMFQGSNVEENPSINELILPKSLLEIKDAAFFDISINSIWYLGNESEFKNITIGKQNTALKNVKYATISR